MNAPAAVPVRALGPEFSAQTDLLPLYLLRFDRENTVRAYRSDLGALFGSEVVTLEMAAAVTFTAVNDALRAGEAQGLSPATLRRRVASWRGFFAWLTALGALDLNPADRHLVRRVPRSKDDKLLTVLTRSEAERLLAAVDLDKPTGPRDYALVTVLLNCVLRRSEAAAMDVEHLDVVASHGVLRLPRTKGGADQIVKVPARVFGVLESYVYSQNYNNGPIWRSHSRNQSRGRRLSGTSIYNVVNKLGVKAGLKQKVGAHTLRHTGCTLAIEGGASLQQVQNHARHKNIDTTMRYVHQRDRLANSAADFIDL